MVGALIYQLWDILKRYIEDRGIVWLVFYISYSIVFSILLKKYSMSYYPTIFGLIGTVLLSITTISLAFTFKGILNKFLNRGGVDISYDIYIYQMPVINIFVNLKRTYPGYYIFLIFFIVLLLSYMSWIFIEKKALLLKNKNR